MIIYTHYSLDIDAASTTALALLINRDKSKVNVGFISADTTLNVLKQRNDFENDYLVLDIDCSGVGLKGEIVTTGNRTIVKSAFSLYLSSINNETFYNAYKDLANFLDEVDSGFYEKTSNLDINYVFNALKKIYKDNDAGLLEVWTKVIEGYYYNWGSYLLAIEQANAAKWVTSKIAVIRNNTQPQTASILLNRGADFVIYQEDNNMGVLLNLSTVPREFAIELGRVLDGWFVHPSGFLVCWGTKKAKKEVPPIYTLKELIGIINNLYYD